MRCEKSLCPEVGTLIILLMELVEKIYVPSVM
jgi:hypothetical protein